jgi:Domain of unknown function (DUF4333)
VLARVSVAVVLVVLALGLSACSVSYGSSHEIDPKKAEKLLYDNVHPKPKSVVCPSGVKEVKGGTFACTIVLTDGRKGTVTMHMTNGSGEVHVSDSDIHLSPKG